MAKHVGILTAGGDSPGLNAAIRSVGKSATGFYGMELLGIHDGFKGLVENRVQRIGGDILSGILTVGGTILGTSRDKPHKMMIGSRVQDMTDVIVENYHANHLDVLVCLGGGGTQKNALRLLQAGLNIITLPKTIDNDVAMTDVTFGFDTALGIATDAIDRLHSTAHSHHRIIIVEIMGHKSGWLTLGAGIAGGADVILLPEIAYEIDNVAEAIRDRVRKGKNFSIVAVAEGAMPAGYQREYEALNALKQSEMSSKEKKAAKTRQAELEQQKKKHTFHLGEQLEMLTGLETRVTILGYLQRGGAPSAADRLLATQLGSACAALIEQGKYGVMVAARGGESVPVALEEVAGQTKLVPLDHPWVTSARHVGTSFGDS